MCVALHRADTTILRELWPTLLGMWIGITVLWLALALIAFIALELEKRRSQNVPTVVSLPAGAEAASQAADAQGEAQVA